MNNPTREQWREALVQTAGNIDPDSPVDSVSVSLVKTDDDWFFEGKIGYQDGSKTTVI